MPLPPLAQTLLLPLWGRAAYARWFPHRRDALVDALLDAVGADRAALQRAMGDYGAVALGRRSAWVLDAARDFVAAHSDAHILNLGAGLDGLLHRLDGVPATSVSVDLPEVVALRAAHLPSDPREVAMAADLLGDTWLTHMSATKPTLVVMAGTAMYLPPSGLTTLLQRLSERLAPGARLLVDTYSPPAAGLTNAMIRLTGLTEAPVYAGLSHDEVRHAAPRLHLVAAQDVLAQDLVPEPLPAGLGLWTRLQLVLARALRFTACATWEVR